MPLRCPPDRYQRIRQNPDELSPDFVIHNIAEENCTAEEFCPVSLLSVVSKVFRKLVNNRSVDHLEKCSLFSDFQYGFRSSGSTAGLVTVVSD